MRNNYIGQSLSNPWMRKLPNVSLDEVIHAINLARSEDRLLIIMVDVEATIKRNRDAYETLKRKVESLGGELDPHNTFSPVYGCNFQDYSKAIDFARKAIDGEIPYITDLSITQGVLSTCSRSKYMQ